MRKALFLCFLCISFLIPVFSFAETTPLNAGFVQGIWYSKFPFFAGDTVRIYAGIQNRSGFDIVGTVSFLKNGVEIGTADFSAINGRFVEVWKDWKAESGDQKISAKIKNTFKSEAGKSPEAITLSFADVPADDVVVDTDIDKNGIGDKEDRKAGLDPAKKLAENSLLSSINASSTLGVVTEKVTDAFDLVKEKLPQDSVEKVSGSISKVDTFMQDLSQKVSVASQGEALKLEDPDAPKKTVRVYKAGLDFLSFVLHQWKWAAILLLLIIIVLWTRRARRSRYSDFS